MVKLRLCVSGKNTREVLRPSQSVTLEHVMSMCLLIGDIDLEYMVEVVSPGSSHCEVTSFPFELHQHLEGDTALNRGCWEPKPCRLNACTMLPVYFRQELIGKPGPS